MKKARVRQVVLHKGYLSVVVGVWVSVSLDKYFGVDFAFGVDFGRFADVVLNKGLPLIRPPRSRVEAALFLFLPTSYIYIYVYTHVFSCMIVMYRVLMSYGSSCRLLIYCCYALGYVVAGRGLARGSCVLPVCCYFCYLYIYIIMYILIY